MIATQEPNNQAASTSSSPVYQQVPSSHVPKRKISSTNKRKTKRIFAETPRDVSESPEFHIEEAEVAMEVQEQPEGPDFHMKDAEGALERSLNNQRVQNSIWKMLRVLGRFRNRVYPRGPYTSRNIPFTGNEGMQQPLSPNPTAEDFFKLYINEDIIDHIVTQQYIEREQNNLRPHSVVTQWKPTDRQEMIAFLAMLIMMGIIHEPRINMYWSKDSLLSTPVFGQLMGRDISIYLLLLRFLHFANNRDYNAADPNRDKLYKIREVSDMIKRRCS